jgi:hypothetical protein
MFRLTIGDFFRGLLIAVMTPVMVAFLAVLNRVVTDPGFDVFSLDFVALLKELTNVFIVSAYGGSSAYIIKNLLTDSNQNFLGIGSQKE